MTKRDAIMMSTSKTISNIIKQLKVPKSTAYDVVMRYKSLVTQKIVPKANAFAHVVRKATFKPFERG